MSGASPAFKVRAGQREFERGVDRFRVCGLVARRQYGKTTIVSRIALKKMMKRPGHTVVFGSVKLDLGREIVRKESEQIQKALALLGKDATAAAKLLDIVDGVSGQSVADVRPEDFADLYESQRLEFRLWHDNVTYSRTKVVALTPQAVGETGDLLLDEVGRVKNFMEVWEAVSPIIASNPEFRCCLTTTPPPDDSHYSWELLAPPVGWDPNASPAGNWYRSELGVQVLRLTAYDAYTDGIPLYDNDTGAAIAPDESRARDANKDAWDRNYGCLFLLGGTAAIGWLVLSSAQQRGVGKCRCIEVKEDLDFEVALEFLRQSLGDGVVGLGFDVATTEKQTSNPSSITVMEMRGVEPVGVLTVVWKEADPGIVEGRLMRLVVTIQDRPKGGRARRLAIDSSNETYFAKRVQRLLAALIPVELVKGGETVEQPGGEKITKKALLGAQLVAAFDDNRISVAPERYIKDDLRRVKKDRGSFDADLGPNGEHGDTFDSHKLALHALTSTAGGLESVEGIRLGGGGGIRTDHRPRFRARTLR